jgi:hypothetical protein
MFLRWIAPGHTSAIAARWRGAAERWAHDLVRYRRLGNHTRVYPDGTRVTVKYTGGEMVRLFVEAAQRVRYQFFGTTSWLFKTYEDPTLPGRYLPLGYALAVDQRGTKAPATILVTTLKPADDNPLPYEPDALRMDRRLRVRPFHQPDASGARQWFPTTTQRPLRYAPWLLTTWQQARPCAGLGWYTAGSAARFETVDQGFDRAPTLFSGATPAGALRSPQGSDWYGQAALFDLPNRSFVIAVDADSTFYCYPVAGVASTTPIEPTHPGESGNVPKEYVKHQACPWPAWVTPQPVGQAALDSGVSTSERRGRLRPLWVFHPDGTKAVCITACRLPVWSDAAITSAIHAPDGAFDESPQEDLPGLVEVGFEVALTGERPQDFSFAVRLLRGDDPQTDTSGRIPVAAAYLLRPYIEPKIDTEPEHITPIGALVVLDYQHALDAARLAEPAITTPPGHNPAIHPPLFELQRPDKATLASLRVEVDGGWRTIRTWLAYYACYPPAGRPRRFAPHIEDFDELAGKTPAANYFTYLAQIVSLDLGALATCIAATATTLGAVRDDYWTWTTHGAEALALVTHVWNVEVDRQLLGHPTMREVCLGLLLQTEDHRPWPTMAPIGINATVEYTALDAVWELDAWAKATQYATLVVNSGLDAPPLARAIINAAEDVLAVDNLRQVARFAGATALVSPRVFSDFDGLYVVRPGIRWKINADIQPGETLFTGYPLGALHHASVLFLTTVALCNTNHRFNTHPDGSWALFADPFAARTELAALYRNGSPLYPAVTFEQAAMDRIVLVDRKRREAQTTHTTAMGAALNFDEFPVDEYHFNLRHGAQGAEVKPASTDPTPHTWVSLPAQGPLGVILARQTFEDGRWSNHFCFDDTFVVTKRHSSYSSFTTFPTPRQEGVLTAVGG